MPRTKSSAALVCAMVIIAALLDARCVAGSGASPDAHATPLDLLPCPYSLPCIASAPDDIPERSEPGASEPVRNLLPCSDSVPCVAVRKMSAREARGAKSTPHRTGKPRPVFQPLALSIVAMPKMTVGVSPAHGVSTAKSDESTTTKVDYPVLGRSAPTVPYSRPIITMANGSSGRKEAQKQLVRAEHDLMHIQRTRLSPDEVKTYEVARRFEREAKLATNQKRYLIAVGLSRKASSLARNLAYQQEIGQRTTEAANALNEIKAKLLGDSVPQGEPGGYSARSMPRVPPRP